ncbi:Helicase associated domain protein [Streptomyces sp. DSM 44917]|uniref:Helicase associated domain protein n=1 Tax=Streptomyces boetiae TaxID=3075541 RepID=A0ABU2L6U3_9ACTN|nr:Helicase associated domain protein [Streptomyces sp. DSM 44917]MDT0307285.1 Helicase associated domain protein [Streptomyces sp. DSM 44917]
MSSSALDHAELWPHQRAAVAAVAEGLQAGPRVQVVMACGTGKTRVGAHTAGGVPGTRRLIVAPTVDLLAQALAEWGEVLGEHGLGRVIAVCSDTGVMERQASSRQAVRAHVTTDPARIAALAGDAGVVTAASTYSSLPQIAQAHLLHGLAAWDALIADEAHRTVGAQGRRWSTVHDDVRVPARRRLYLTATPRIIDSPDGAAGEMASMHDPKVFGPEVYRLTYAAAREDGLLADYRVVVSVVRDEEVRRLAAEAAEGRGAFFRVGRTAIAPSMLARQLAVLRAAAEFRHQRLITYHHRVRDAHWVARTLPAVAAEVPGFEGRVWAGCVHGSQSSRQRQEVLERLRADTGEEVVVVTNARVLSEGVDAPAVDAVAFLDGRDSVIDTIQAVGRALRLGGRKEKTASVIIPVILTEDQDPQQGLAGSQWAGVWRVLRALRAHDERLAEFLDRQRQDAGYYGPALAPEAQLPDWLHVTGIPLPAHFAAAIRTHAIQAATVAWEEFYGAARAWRESHGDLLIPLAHHTGDGLALGAWLARQRQVYREGRLLPERVRLLEELGVVWNPLQADRERYMAAARAYARRRGDLDVRTDYTEGGVKLGAWLLRVRTGGVKISDEQRAELDGLGMVWDRAERRWQEMLAAARAYRERHGNLLVPVDFVVPGDPPLRLGEWIVNRRTEEATLPPQRRQALEELGMVWGVHRQRWTRMLRAAEAFRAEHGHLDVPADLLVDTGSGEAVSLRAWLKKQRDKHHTGRLAEERHQALTKLGMVWNPHDEQWERGFQAARAYRKTHGHLLIPHDYTTGDPPFPLGVWLHTQRQAAGRNPQRRQRLEALGMVWNTLAYRWERNFQAAREFYATHGHLRIPDHHAIQAEDGETVRLGAWIHTQRTAFRKGKLDLEKINKLTGIGMRWQR